MALNSLPNAGQNLAETRQPIKDNFDFINAGFLVNHVAFNGGVNTGKHNFVTMPVQGGGPVTVANEFALYSKSVAGTPQMFLRSQNNGAEVDFTSLTASQTNGYCRLPNGILIKWGQRTATGVQTLAYPVAAGIPVFANSPFMVQLTPINATGAVASLAIAWNPNNSNGVNLAVVATNGAGVAAAVTFQYLAFGFAV